MPEGQEDSWCVLGVFSTRRVPFQGSWAVPGRARSGVVRCRSRTVPVRGGRALARSRCVYCGSVPPGETGRLGGGPRGAVHTAGPMQTNSTTHRDTPRDTRRDTHGETRRDTHKGLQSSPARYRIASHLAGPAAPNGCDASLWQAFGGISPRSEQRSADIPEIYPVDVSSPRCSHADSCPSALVCPAAGGTISAGGVVSRLVLARCCGGATTGHTTETRSG